MAEQPRDRLAPTEEYKADRVSLTAASKTDTDLSQDIGSNTGIAPSFHSLVPKANEKSKKSLPPGNLPNVGEKYADFELVRVLGSGSFAKVFLARQMSLD